MPPEWVPPHWWEDKPFICDGCDKVRRWIWSTDGRTLVCIWCRIRYWRKF